MLFDVIQATGALVAAIFLGFLVTGADGVYYGSDSYRSAWTAANGAILLICSASLLIYGCDADRGRITYNAIRSTGLVLSMVGFAVTWRVANRTVAAVVLLVQLFVLYFMLAAFLYKTMKETPPESQPQ